MTNHIEQEIRAVIEKMENQKSQDSTQTPQEEIQDVYVLIVREREVDEDPLVVDSAPVKHKRDSMAFLPVCMFLLVIVSTLAFQLYCIVTPPVATITIMPKSQTVTLTGTLQLGRALQPLTLSQSQTTATTGKGHQDAKAATGYITFYNGQQTEQTIAQGTEFTGNDGVSIETTQSATIPPGNPSTGYGTATVTAQALQAGSNGNIQAGDVNTPVAVAVFVKNTQFTGGQDERDFQTVAKKDIDTISTPLKTAVTKSVAGAFQGQLKQGEALYLLPCSPTVTSDHAIGEEATTVKVTVSQTCSAIGYSSQESETKVAAFLSTQIYQKVGAGYSLFGTVHVSVTQATIQKQVIVSYNGQGTWVYAIGNMEQQYIKRLIAGKTRQKALQLLTSLPGVKQTAIRFGGLSDATRIPKDLASIHLVLIFPA